MRLEAERGLIDNFVRLEAGFAVYDGLREGFGRVCEGFVEGAGRV